MARCVKYYLVMINGNHRTPIGVRPTKQLSHMLGKAVKMARNYGITIAIERRTNVRCDAVMVYTNGRICRTEFPLTTEECEQISKLNREL